MPYTINQLAKMANVSVRTLHHYDAMGLLTSRRNDKNQYRAYEEADLLKLQQILFFRELDFSLVDIKAIIENPKFDIETALKDHKQIILLKQKRLQGLIRTIDKTISKVTNKKNMKDEELYDSFTKEEMNELADEAKKRWGNTSAYKESEQKMRNMTKGQMDVIKKEGDDILRRGAALLTRDGGVKANSAEAQDLVAGHYKHLSNFYTPNPEMYKGLAEMYISDTRFKSHFEAYHPELPQFMHDAMLVFVEKQK